MPGTGPADTKPLDGIRRAYASHDDKARPYTGRSKTEVLR